MSESEQVIGVSPGAATIKTRSGNYIDILNPSPDTIDIDSIAFSLSNICRFGGHIPFYSVAEHSYWCYWLCVKDVGKTDLDLLKAVLLHDASESISGDVIRPLKYKMPDYMEIERNITNVIAERFGVNFDVHHDKIKQYDNEMLKAEKRKFWPSDNVVWNGFESIRDVMVPIANMEPTVAYNQFLAAAYVLGIK